jgi:TATA-box binding protein (TBP) (component of TFIID and TFIIIB)
VAAIILCPNPAPKLALTPLACLILHHSLADTGRLVGTGTSGPDAARLAIARAQMQMAQEANVHLHVRNFATINSVGAVSLRATLNCDAFALAHSSESHFDRSSFVGLAWRPPRSSICCEIYSTGRANLPGSVVERQLLGSFSHMLPGKCDSRRLSTYIPSCAI